MQYVRNGRNPFQLLLLGSCVAVGVGGALGRKPSSALTALWSDSGVRLWDIGYGVAGLIGILGASAGVSRGAVTEAGLLWERVGLATLAGLSLSFLFGVYAVGGSLATPGAAGVLAFGAAAVWRYIQIVVDLRHAAQRAEARRRRGEPPGGGR